MFELEENEKKIIEIENKLEELRDLLWNKFSNKWVK